ncbi:hypothetical protein QT236_18230 (plasmid) [Geobacillus stearothermophilus]|nr:hypothetical protein QT236_18230 [Geobacillus stearothermophilus]
MAFITVTSGHETKTFKVLDRDIIEQIIYRLDAQEIIETAYRGYIPYKKTGHATINLKSGKLETVSLGKREFPHPFDDIRIYLFSIELIDNEDLLDEREIKIKNQYAKQGKSFNDFCRENNIDIKQRSIQLALNDLKKNWDLMSCGIVDQLDHFYL